MKSLRLVSLLLVLALLQGCATSFRVTDENPLAGTTLVGMKTSDGNLRSYRVYEPKGLSTETVPLLIVLHGTGSNSARMIETGDFRGHADANGYLLVAPDALGRAFNEGAGRIGEGFLDLDDVAFMEELVARLRNTYSISKVFLTGFSSGSAMVQRVALESPGLADAVAGVAGHLWAPLLDTAPAVLVPVPMLLLYGDSDPLNPVRGGDVTYGQHLTVHKPPPRSTAQHWATRFGCEVSISASAHLVRTTAWAKCTDDVTVQLSIVEGLGHYWPGGTVSSYATLPTSRVGNYVSSVNATNIIWRFFLSATN